MQDWKLKSQWSVGQLQIESKPTLVRHPTTYATERCTLWTDRPAIESDVKGQSRVWLWSNLPTKWETRVEIGSPSRIQWKA